MEKTKRNFTGKMLAVILCLVFLCAAGIVVYLRILPVDYDAGACSGGYETFIFDKYNEELVKLYCNDLEDGSAISSAKAIKGTEQADWEKRTIYMQFNIQYEHATKGTVTETVEFTGKRTWFDTYDWSVSASNE